MQILHRGFDTIALAIRANISNELFDFLEAEKTFAESARNPVPIFYNGESLELLQDLRGMRCKRCFSL